MLIRNFTRLCLSLMIGLCLVSPMRADDAIVETKTGEITLKVPAHWKKLQPSSNLRLGQFEIPPAGGDTEPAELAVFSFGNSAGGVEANVTRWKEQFLADGRTSHSKSGKCPTGEYVVLEVSGTYKKPIGPPIQQKTQPLPNAKMLAVILPVEGKGNYFLKLTGPAKTVDAAADQFRKSFGGNAAEEKPQADK